MTLATAWGHARLPKARGMARRWRRKMIGGPRLAYDAEPDTYAGSGAGAGVGSSDAVSKICEWALSNLDAGRH